MIKRIKKKILKVKFDKIKILLLVILIAGFLIRVLGVYPGYSPYHPDEGKAGYSSAWFMFMNRTLDLPHYHYPALIPTIELFFMVLFFIPILWIKLLTTNPDIVLSNLNKLPEIFQNYIALRSDVEIMFLSRYLMVAFGVLTLVFSYLTAKTLFSSRRIGLFTALVLAVNLRAVSSSQLDLPDGYSGFFLILAFYILSRLKDNPSLKFYILSGVSIGLAISAKLQFFSLLPFSVLHLYLALKQKTVKGKLITLFSKKVFFWGLTGLSYFYHIVLTPGVVALSLVGLIVGLIRHRLSTFLVLCLVAFYLYYFIYLTRGWFYPRNFVSVVPFFAILAGLGLENVWNFLNSHIKKISLATGIFIVIISLALFGSIRNLIVHTVSYSKPWNIVTMRSCIEKNVAFGKTVAAHPTDKYILFSLPSIDVNKKLNFIPINIETSYSLAELQEEKADYALVGLDVVGDSNSVWWMTKPNYWDKPVGVAKNLFVSLAAVELFQNTVCSSVKPWQAVENNYAFVSIPSPTATEWEKVEAFEFDSESGLTWKKVDGFFGLGNNLILDKEEGRQKEGALKIISVTPKLPVVRWVSPVFEVVPGKVYKAEAWIKSTVPVEQKRRDGFLRLDFLNTPTNFLSLAIYTSRLKA
ncbi:MAG: hypothetical protein UV33_C0006G0009 [Candidatus Daviesbacteria bacterium GW2011_GWA1_42_6]|uniref:Glycosyltransferase RgtA/B/C/D-like domain-containing protein n=1 Tax=Candidatus Daviesbacteria bacterium GW2011_GWA1_42_6 TaxID=1618420 RepID=A0A0G1AWJ1_9BACT|nr:MAG: hypothetical protein UV33_C0006G0009 [Candidatus Daviesbacteria bacterium GW2011_GWA1_42_6]